MVEASGSRPRRPYRKIAIGATIVLLATLVGLVAFLPDLLGTTIGRRRLLIRANRFLAPATLDAAEISLSWTKPTELRGLVLTAPDGNRVIEAPRASLDRSLWRILRESPRLGTLVLHEARVDLKRRADGSIDLFEALKPILKPNPALDLTVLVERGDLRFRTEGFDAPFQADRAEISLRFPPGLKPLTFNLALADSKRPGGRLTIDGWVDRGVPRPDFQLRIANDNDGRRTDPASQTARLETADPLRALSLAATIERRAGAWKANGRASARRLELPLDDSDKNRRLIDDFEADWKLSRVGDVWKIAAIDVKTGAIFAKAGGDDSERRDDPKRSFAGLSIRLTGSIDESKGSEARRLELTGTFSPTSKRGRANSEIVYELGDGRFRATGLIKNGMPALQAIEALDLKASLTLKSLDCFGMRVGETEIVAGKKGEEGRWKIEPMETTLNGGRLRLDPSLDRDAEGRWTLKLGAGTSLEEAEVNDEVSRRVLAYVAPVLERATRATGKVSLALRRAEIPLASRSERSIEVEGRVVFRGLEFAPGPLTTQLYEAIGRDPTAAVLKIDEPVELTIADGRVRQNGLSIPVGDSKIEIAGSVGFDRTLDLRAKVPIVPERVGEKGFLGALAAGTRVTVPIGGTLSQPRFDREAFRLGLRDLGKDLIDRGATLGLNELISRLSKPRDPNAPPPPPRLTPEQRRELRLERKAERSRRKEMRRRGIHPESTR